MISGLAVYCGEWYRLEEQRKKRWLQTKISEAWYSLFAEMLAVAPILVAIPSDCLYTGSKLGAPSTGQITGSLLKSVTTSFLAFFSR